MPLSVTSCAAASPEAAHSIRAAQAAARQLRMIPLRTITVLSLGRECAIARGARPIAGPGFLSLPHRRRYFKCEPVVISLHGPGRGPIVPARALSMCLESEAWGQAASARHPRKASEDQLLHLGGPSLRSARIAR